MRLPSLKTLGIYGMTVTALGTGVSVIGYQVYKGLSGEYDQPDSPEHTKIINKYLQTRVINFRGEVSNRYGDQYDENGKRLENWLSAQNVKKVALTKLTDATKSNQKVNTTKSGKPVKKTISGTGFILGSATAQTAYSNQHIYFVITDINTVNAFSDEYSSVNVSYGFYPYSPNNTHQIFLKGSIDPSWRYQGTNIKFDNIPDEYKNKDKDKLGVGYGVMMVDLDPSKSNQPNPSTPSLSPNSSDEIKDKYLKELKANINQYGDVVIDNTSINKGYMLNYRYDHNRSLNMYLDTFTRLSKSLRKRSLSQDQGFYVDKDQYWSPVYDYQLPVNGAQMGAPLISFNPDEKNPKRQFTLSGIVTQRNNNKTYITKLGHFYDSSLTDYESVNEWRSTSDNSLCASIDADKNIGNYWLKPDGSESPFYTPDYCQ